MYDKPIDVYVDLPTVRSHLVNWGGPLNAPAVLLIHGAASNARMWNLVAPNLAKSFRVVALDQRSHGLTQPPTDNDFGFAAVCDDMHRVCSQLGLSRRIVVGHSWGGNVVLEYAARYPDEVIGIVMIEGGFVGLNKVATWSQVEAMTALPRWAGTPLVDYLERVRQLWGELYRDEVLAEVMGNVAVLGNQTVVPHLSFANHTQILRTVWEQDTALYAQVKCPALFLLSLPPAPHDRPTEQILNWKRKMVVPHIQSVMPQTQVEWLLDSVHDVPLQHPELIAEKIRAFAATFAPN